LVIASISRLLLHPFYSVQQIREAVIFLNLSQYWTVAQACASSSPAQRFQDHPDHHQRKTFLHLRARQAGGDQLPRAPAENSAATAQFKCPATALDVTPASQISAITANDVATTDCMAKSV
jgi:hypothetical protein